MKKRESGHEKHCKAINADMKRAQYLACSIYPGDGFRHSENADISGMLLELLNIVAKYDAPDDREQIVYLVAEAIYPTTLEG